jgi:hypothetical protein
MELLLKSRNCFCIQWGCFSSRGGVVLEGNRSVSEAGGPIFVVNDEVPVDEARELFLKLADLYLFLKHGQSSALL